MIWKLHIEKIEAKAFRTFITLYSLFKSGRINSNIKLTLHKALIRSVMTYASPAWEFAAETYLLKLQRLQNKAFRTICSFPRGTSVRDMHMAFRKSYKIMKTKMLAILDKAKPGTGNTKGLNLAAVMFTTVQVSRLTLWPELLVSNRA
jgi:hypothetical protein